MPSASSARPPTADFASVMGIGYHPTDSFRWHTDMAGDDGWVLSISLGAAATFYSSTCRAPPARRGCARMRSRKTLECGACILWATEATLDRD